jgi:hypothetical protein
MLSLSNSIFKYKTGLQIITLQVSLTVKLLPNLRMTDVILIGQGGLPSDL